MSRNLWGGWTVNWCGLYVQLGSLEWFDGCWNCQLFISNFLVGGMSYFLMKLWKRVQKLSREAVVQVQSAYMFSLFVGFS